MTDALDRLLDRLTKGEMDAAGEVYVAFEPVLRVMVRRRLTPRMRAKFDSTDVVQSAWVDVLKGFGDEGWHLSDREHLRAYLARVTYNHLVNHCRRHRLVMQHEQPLDGDGQPGVPDSAQPRPSELAQADEFWELLVGLCPPGPSQPAPAQAPGLSARRDRRPDRAARKQRASHPLRPGAAIGCCPWRDVVRVSLIA